MAFTQEQEETLREILNDPKFQILNKHEIKVIYYIGMWNLYSSGYIAKIADIAIQIETLKQDKLRLWTILQNTAFTQIPQGRIPPWHQRQFACCRVY